MAEIQSHGLCVMGCGRRGTHRQRMYCEWCYNTWRRGGFDKTAYRVRVKAVKGPSGRIIRKSYMRTQWKRPADFRPPGYQSLQEARQMTDRRPRCKDPECNNLARHGGLCDKHNGRAAARIQRYRAEGVIKQRNAVQKQKLRQRQAA